MRLLIVTQAIDEQDTILGFFTAWVQEFAKHCDQIIVIAQRTGTYQLPDNVQVLSLGKECSRSRVSQILRFWKLIWQERKNYDVAFVHMIPWWIVLGAPIWKLLQKPVYLWYLHRSRSLVLRTALLFVQHVFAATDVNNGATGKKMITTGHGIDTSVFTMSDTEKREPLIVSVGRVSPVKNFDQVIDTFASLPQKYHLRIAGSPYTATDKNELTKLRNQIKKLNLEDRITITKATRTELVSLLQKAELFIHTCQGFDKAALEAMACGCLVVSTFPAIKKYLPQKLWADPTNLLQVVQAVLAQNPASLQTMRRSLQQTVQEQHSLARTIQHIMNVIHQIVVH